MSETFQCERCGNCCRGEGFVYVTPEDVRRIADHLDLNELEFRNRFTFRVDRRSVLTSHKNRDCIFYEKNACIIHEVKPAQCAAWPFWPEIVAHEESFDAAQEYCAGLKHLDYELFKKAAAAKKRQDTE